MDQGKAHFPGDLVRPLHAAFVWANDPRTGSPSMRKLLTLNPRDCAMIVHVMLEKINAEDYALIVCGPRNELGWIDLNQVTKL